MSYEDRAGVFMIEVFFWVFKRTATSYAQLNLLNESCAAVYSDMKLLVHPERLLH